jgi:hypothetical protein
MSNGNGIIYGMNHYTLSIFVALSSRSINISRYTFTITISTEIESLGLREPIFIDS